jgi:hypothetical protein
VAAGAARVLLVIMVLVVQYQEAVVLEDTLKYQEQLHIMLVAVVLDYILEHQVRVVLAAVGLV